MSDGYRVFWQPGCTSCLKAKEFLKANGIPFQSVNVRETPGAMDELAARGIKSVPVVMKDDRFVFAQELDDLASFVGLALDRTRLAPAELVEKLDLILAAAQRYLAQVPPEVLSTPLPGRDRDTLDLGFHIFVIPVAFLDAAEGATLTFDYFDRRPDADQRSVGAVVAYGQGVRDRLAAWWSAAGAAPETVETYYGTQSGARVLERTAWHAAQHCRQLAATLEGNGIAPDGPLGPAALDGLPLPEEVYDDEVQLEAAQGSRA